MRYGACLGEIGSSDGCGDRPGRPSLTATRKGPNSRSTIRSLRASKRLRPRRAVRVLAALGLICAWALVPVAAATSDSLGSLNEASRACQTCHGIEDWQITDPVAKRTVFLSIETTAYLRSSHGSLDCHACHDPGYDGKPPHRGQRGHPLYLCVLCHDKDPKLQWLHLPERKADLQKSVHGKTDNGPLDCHGCHDPHTFQPVNDSEDAFRRIERSNAICLSCHDAKTNHQSRFDQPDSGPAHDRFPNYENHLRKVKCIACHTTDTASTRHDIRSKDHAVSECSQCHAPTSPVLDIVYGPQRVEQSNSLIEDAYVIGSSRSPKLERLSVIAFLVLLGTIALHALARVVYWLKRRSTNE